ncbi:uncharacterized protein LOC131160730 [Malania oleifera]|uniref:uncharacterized protein LOC131160730 n=1 Tax=Malania oleifera TaxID=397392 RepID=UPI0025AE72DA|nr:uncharacterized protein LOC131160730 [Malania oleifera]XP_057972589.1 uncharacterized protein LOC131160730 [Malania oleifera]
MNLSCRSEMATAMREHVEEIRKMKFSIGQEFKNPLTEDLHQAVKIFSAELYAKDVHFLMELIQNAEDNEYPEGVDPSLEFIITSRDITGTGASSTLLVFNNEKGFLAKNIDSICSVGRSTKKGNRKRGYIGEKGIGFKSVFLISAQPHIFSNGYHIRFNEEPCPHCNVGYIVPEWVEDDPILSDIKRVYGAGNALPTTTIVLPLKPDKVIPVKQQLSCIHPEVLLFLSKIKQLSVKEDNEDPRLSTLSAVAISRETDFVTRKNIDAESYTLHLSTDEDGEKFQKECRYYMWRQKFPVKHENRVERRMEVEEWVITLSFPYGERLRRGTSSPGVYAFLPTEMVTNFPFIIQADFLLASSRETILFDDKWNQGILECVPHAFINAFKSLVVAREGVPVSNLPPLFGFLPINSSSYSPLNAVRESIKVMLVEENIIPSETYTDQKFFHRPCEVGRLMPAFWNILSKAKMQGVSLHNLSSHGSYILNSSFDQSKYNSILNFLGVKAVDNEWYAKCIRSSNLVLGVSEDVYLELLCFLAENWLLRFQNSNMKSIPLLKYVDFNLNVSLCTINEAAQRKRMFISHENHCISWLIDWNREFRSVAGWDFLPKSTQEAIFSSSQRATISKWLIDMVNITAVKVYGYADLLANSLNGDRKLAVAYAHLLYHSLSGDYLTEREAKYLCDKMPLVDNYGCIATRRNGVLVPANGSQWVELIGSNPWRDEGYLELGEDYLHSSKFAGVCTAGKEMIKFLKKHVAASDIPNLTPPDAVIPSVSTPLTKRNVFLLLDWIQNMRCKRIRLPNRFLKCIKEGSWLKVSLSGSPGYRPPSESFLLTSSWGNLLQNGSVLVDIPLIDQEFYGCRITDYREELITIGVRFEYGEACQFIGERLMFLAASSSLTRSNVFSILNFIRFLREKMLPVDDFVHAVRERRWLRTSRGDMSPVGSVLSDKEWRAASLLSDIPFIDQDYYGKEILSYKKELQLLGVIVGFNKNYQLVIDYLKPSMHIDARTSESFLLILECIRHVGSSNKFSSTLKDRKCLKTNVGFMCPCQCFLFNAEWGCLLKVFNSFPLIDLEFYGSNIGSYENELKKIGVVVDFEDAAKIFVHHFQKQASLSSIKKEHSLSFLACYKHLARTSNKFPRDLKKSISEVKWLRTRLGDYRCPKECILSGPDWKAISPIALLPFIDDGEKHYGDDIHEYRKELKSMGVVTELKYGAKFVAAGLYFPSDPGCITPANVMSLLECIQILQKQQEGPLPEALLNKVSKKWIKTHFGYASPDNCLLYDGIWGALLQRNDGPFIDEEFYGSNIASYRKELNAIGVTVDVTNGCPLLASHLDFHSELTSVIRIYNYLNKFNWKPDGEADRKIWIPNGSDSGEWVSPEDCALHDKEGLFGSQLNILDKHYEQQLLSFFSNAFGVKLNPSVDDYCKLWKVWESSEHQLSQAECCAFWGHATRHWGLKTPRALVDSLVKLPTDSDSGEILLFNKGDVFLADDLLLKDLFQQSSPRPIFVWCPRSSLPSLPRTKLLEIYRNIGVRTISESVKSDDLSMINIDEKPVNLFKKGLFKLILGFLADPSVRMEVERRHEVAKRLVSVSVFETPQPIAVSYSLSLSSGEVITVSASRMIRWDRESSKLLIQKVDKSEKKEVIEFATYFAEVISEGLLWDKEECIRGLSELIKLASMLEFDKEAIEFLMKYNNLQLFAEDEDFISTTFPSD